MDRMEPGVPQQTKVRRPPNSTRGAQPGAGNRRHRAVFIDGVFGLTLVLCCLMWWSIYKLFGWWLA